MKKEKNSRGRCTMSSKWHPPFCLFYSSAYFTLPLYLLFSQPLATCHPATQKLEGGLSGQWWWIKLYSHFHFQRNTSHCHQIPAKLPVKGGKDIRDNVDNYPRRCWKNRVGCREMELGEALTLHKRDAMSDFALVPMLLGDGVQTVQQRWFIFQDYKPPGSHPLKPGPQHQNVRASHGDLPPGTLACLSSTSGRPIPTSPFLVPTSLRRLVFRSPSNSVSDVWATR